MSLSAISMYKRITDVNSDVVITIDSFLNKIKSGYWQDLVIPIRIIEDKKVRTLAKEKLPVVTISGSFSKKENRCLISHSGFIAIDFDNLFQDVEIFKNQLQADPYVYAAFTSVSGTGMCVLIRIEPTNHSLAFDSISDYFITNYSRWPDRGCRDISRGRYISYDPYIYINENAEIFLKYLPIEKKKVPEFIFIESDFERIIKEISELSTPLFESYSDWILAGFGIADKFGEVGRKYFHLISSNSKKYDPTICDRQYNYAILGKEKIGNKISIGTIYFFAKKAGIQIFSQSVQKIASATSTLKKSGLGITDISKTIEKFEGITGVDEIISQVYSSNKDFTNTQNIVDNVKLFLSSNYSLRRNRITMKLENNFIEVTEIELNTIYLNCFSVFKKLTFDLFKRIILSGLIETYCPFDEFLGSQKWDGHCRIEQLSKCINSNTGSEEWRERMLTKWLVGIIDSMMGGKNELNFILVGKKNSGKTEFFRNLLPKELLKYFSNSQLNRGKDDEILMCEKLIILNDEYGGKNKFDERNEKRLMSTNTFSLRPPFGQSNITMRRIASLCGSCNEIEVLDDYTGNRRIIVFEITGKFDYELSDQIDRSQLLLECYDLWQEGSRPILTDEDIYILENLTGDKHSKTSFEEEMVVQYFNAAKDSFERSFMTCSEIKNFLETKTKEKILINKLGARLKKLGYMRIKKDQRYGYCIQEKGQLF